jgi:hypothetical protein
VFRQTNSKINQIGGAVHQGYTQTHKTLTETQTLYAPISGVIEAQKTGTASNFKLTKSPEELNEHKKIIERIQKDHVG